MWRFRVTLYFLLRALSTIGIHHEGFQLINSLSGGHVAKTGFDYYISVYRADRTQAQIDCRQIFFGNLITIPTQDVDQDLNNFVQENSGIIVLTSGIKKHDSDNWYWSTDLVPFNYTNWRPNHPFKHYNCMVIGGGSKNYGWYSVPCGNQVRFICQV